MLVLIRAAVIAQSSQTGRDFVVARRQNPAITRAAEVLRRVKTETPDQAHRARPPSIVRRADRLRGIFNYGDSVSLPDLEQRIHLGALAVKMDRHDDFRSRRDRVRYARWIEVVSARIDIDEDRSRAESSD